MLLDKGRTLVLKPDRKYNALFQRSGLQTILHHTTQNKLFVLIRWQITRSLPCG